MFYVIFLMNPLYQILKGLFIDFTLRVKFTQFTLCVFHFYDLFFATVDFMVFTIGPIAPLQLLVDNFEPIGDTIKSTVAATEIRKNKKHLKITVLLNWFRIALL